MGSSIFVVACGILFRFSGSFIYLFFKKCIYLAVLDLNGDMRNLLVKLLVAAHGT